MNILENITLGQAATAIGFLVALIGGIKYLNTSLKDYLTELMNDKFAALDEKFDDLDKKVDKVDMETCKNFLVRFLADIEKGNAVGDIERQRFWEEYEHYLQKGGNSYVKEWVERLKREGKL